MTAISKKQLHRRFEKARKKRKSEYGFRGRMKKFILDRLIKKEISNED